MTREEAIEVITDYLNKDTAISPYNSRFINALNMAIEALQAEPVVHCRDCQYNEWCIPKQGRSEDDYCSRGKRREDG